MPPFEHPVTVRFSDLDALGHANNAVFLSYLEEARVALFEELSGTRGPVGEGFLLARVEIDFRRELLVDQAVVVRTWLVGIGTTSFTLGYEVLADGQVAAEATSVQVYVDEAGEPTPVPQEDRALLENYQRA